VPIRSDDPSPISCGPNILDIQETAKYTPRHKKEVLINPSNIAEGANRQTKKEFIQFLYIALGSTAELETQIVIAQRLGFINNGETICITITKIRKMINALIKSLKTAKL